jgi:putative NIF3 family GTP cyclohydrolase 1 type 2
VDTFKAGDPDARVKGIAVTMMATLDVLQRAAARGLNLIITHEPTFYSHRDTTAVLERENDAVYAAKQKFIREHGLIVYRFHDAPHRMRPDIIEAGVARALGWQGKHSASDSSLFDVGPMTLDSLASLAGRKLGARAVRLIGNSKSRVSHVAVTEGFPGFAANRAMLQRKGIDALIMGEDHEWETIAYASDAVTAGVLKGVVVVGHTPSEQAGMEEVARWLRTFMKGMPIEFVPSREPFTQAKRLQL